MCTTVNTYKTHISYYTQITFFYYCVDGVGLQTLELGQTSGVTRVSLPQTLNRSSATINIYGGIPFGLTTKDSVYVCRFFVINCAC